MASTASTSSTHMGRRRRAEAAEGGEDELESGETEAAGNGGINTQKAVIIPQGRPPTNAGQSNGRTAAALTGFRR